jgi:membrane protein
VRARVPARLLPLADWLASNWPGRIALRCLAGVARVELFDRAMTIAAQFFTSVFPILIMVLVWAGPRTTERITESIQMPDSTQQVLLDAVDESGSSAFGVIGTLIVLVSATSLSRALTRALAAIWRLPRHRAGVVADGWRWLAAVLALALSLVVIRSMVRFTEQIPPPGLWALLSSFLLDVGLVLFVPWLLLTGRVPARSLLPGALAFAAAMLVVRPSSQLYLPRALAESSDRYGSIGVAFTYLTWLYVVSWVFLAAAILGHAIASDEGRLGGWLRKGAPAPVSPGPGEDVTRAPRDDHQRPVMGAEQPKE